MMRTKQLISAEGIDQSGMVPGKTRVCTLPKRKATNNYVFGAKKQNKIHVHINVVLQLCIGMIQMQRNRELPEVCS